MLLLGPALPRFRDRIRLPNLLVRILRRRGSRRCRCRRRRLRQRPNHRRQRHRVLLSDESRTRRTAAAVCRRGSGQHKDLSFLLKGSLFSLSTLDLVFFFVLFFFLKEFVEGRKGFWWTQCFEGLWSVGARWCGLCGLKWRAGLLGLGRMKTAQSSDSEAMACVVWSKMD